MTIEVSGHLRRGGNVTATETKSLTPATVSDLHRHLEHGAVRDSTVHELDLKHEPDQRVALAKSALEAQSEEGLLIDLAKVAGIMAKNFAIAPIKYAGRQLGRRRNVNDGEVEYYIGADPLNANYRFLWTPVWRMTFEPGVVLGLEGSGRSEHPWRISHAPVPPVPAEYRPEDSRDYFILWEQEWAEKILLPRDPALLQHIVGDLYLVHHVWDLSPLEAAALRGTRTR